MSRFRRTTLLQERKEESDRQLLERFVRSQDDVALETLVRRHAPMVWSVCRRTLVNHDDAEDAFQAAFLVFLRKAASIRSPDLLANWLYRVANQTARKARQRNAKRYSRETQLATMPEPQSEARNGAIGPELRDLLDEELSRLPEKYRIAIVLCDLEAKTHREVAQQLRVAEGTVGSRLARGRALLAKRLIRRGVTVSATSLAAVLIEQAASGAVPAALLSKTIQATTLLAAGRTAADGLISPEVSPLTEGVLQAMTVAKQKAASVVLLLAALAMGGGAVTYYILSSQPSESAQPPEERLPPPFPPPDANARPPAERGNEEKEVNKGRLTAEKRELVKRATVNVRVLLPDGSRVQGSGFFGCKEARNIVLTTAHVVGMLSPESMRPLSVDVIVNCGESDEWITKARVLGIDRDSDLAVLDVGTPPLQLPEALKVKAAGGLRERDDVYVFGSPLGEHLNKEITMRPASVSAMLRKKGIVHRVQLNGAIVPGDSGGPVVDNSGAVVAMAVSRMPDEQISFAIPGEHVLAILDGQLSELTLGQPYFLPDNKVAVPVVVDMIDPRNLVKEVGLEVWTGYKPIDNKAGIPPATTTRPEAQPGDSQHVFYYKLNYMNPEGKAEIVLPELPPGRVYWRQPRWIDAKGQVHWASADAMTPLSHPVHRNPAILALRFFQGAKRTLDLSVESVFKVSGAEEADAFRIHTAAKLIETVVSTGASGSLLNLLYESPPSRDLILSGGKSLPNPTLEQFKDHLPRLTALKMQLDRLGNIILQTIDDRLSRQDQGNPDQLEKVKEFHEMIQQGLELLSASLPPSGMVKPLESWKAERRLPIDTPGKTERRKLDLSFTYQGMRKRDGREEAVISMDGIVRSEDNPFAGRATGQILLDLASGQTILAEMTVKLQIKAMLSKPNEQPRELRLLATMKFHMQRNE